MQLEHVELTAEDTPVGRAVILLFELGVLGRWSPHQSDVVLDPELF